MAFVVETGAGLSNANSYLSEADADSYHADHSGSTDWSGASSSDKQKALRLATQYLDTKYDGRWKGVRTSESQSLAWPRYNVSDSDGYTYDSDDLPQKLKDATAELALKVIEGDTLLDDLTDSGTIKKSRVKVDTIEEEIEYLGGNSPVKKYMLIDHLIKQLIQSSDVLERG